MQTAQGDSPTHEPGKLAAECPIDHTAWSHQKTARAVEPTGKRIERDAAGVWHVYGFDEARAVLRSGDTKQAGFGAQFFEMFATSSNQGILYLEGPSHHEQRRKAARFFTPKAVSANYRPLMERLSDQLIADFRRTKRADLSQMSFALAVQVAAQVVGLTNSRLRGMDKRLAGFFEDAYIMQPGKKLLETIRFMWRQRRFIGFFYLDVKPTINARKRQPQEDVISHLIAQGYNDQEILTECITYAAAGMVTTREFISVAAWHLLEHPELRERYLAAPEEERYEILHETLRLEPVIGHGVWGVTEQQVVISLPEGLPPDLKSEQKGHGASAKQAHEQAYDHLLFRYSPNPIPQMGCGNGLENLHHVFVGKRAWLPFGWRDRVEALHRIAHRQFLPYGPVVKGTQGGIASPTRRRAQVSIAFQKGVNLLGGHFSQRLRNRSNPMAQIMSIGFEGISRGMSSTQACQELINGLGCCCHHRAAAAPGWVRAARPRRLTGWRLRAWCHGRWPLRRPRPAALQRPRPGDCASRPVCPGQWGCGQSDPPKRALLIAASAACHSQFTPPSSAQSVSRAAQK